MGVPTVVQVQCDQAELPARYAECVQKNPLLARIEGTCKTIGWTEVEIRTIQLLTAVQSNASLQARITDLEQALREATALREALGRR